MTKVGLQVNRVASLHTLQRAPDTPRLAAVLILVVVAQALLPLPAHTRLSRDSNGGWNLVCTLATPAGGDQTPSDRPAPGILFAQLNAELLGFGPVVATALPWRHPRPEAGSAPHPAAALRTFPTAIRAPPVIG